MRCTLLLPAFLAMLSRDRDLLRSADVPVLTRLLNRARYSFLDGERAGSWLLTQYGVARQRDWPEGPFCCLGDGLSPEMAYWLRCDPIHVVPRRSELIWDYGAELKLMKAESDALIASLNAHFHEQGLAFHAPAPGRWYLRLAEPAVISTHPLFDLAGIDIHRRLPEGRDKLAWHARINEMQMLLHQHPVNQAREDSSQPTVNSVWLWGGGTLANTTAHPYSDIWSDDPLCRGLALSSGGEPHPSVTLSAAFAAVGASDGSAVSILAQISSEATPAHALHDRALLAQIEQAWMTPLYAALKCGTLQSLTLLGFDASGGHCYQLARGDLWKFWRGYRASRS